MVQAAFFIKDSRMNDLHQFGVYIANEMDEIRLRYLLEQIGAAKLRSSVTKYQKKYPHTQPYVSTLLKCYRITVPTHLYIQPKNKESKNGKNW